MLIASKLSLRFLIFFRKSAFTPGFDMGNVVIVAHFLGRILFKKSYFSAVGCFYRD